VLPALVHNSLLLGLSAGLLWQGRRLGVLATSVGLAASLLAVGGVLALGLALLSGAGTLPIFEAMGLFAWAPFVHLPLALLAAALLFRRAEPRGAAAAAGAAGLVALLGTWSFLIEPRWLEVSHHELRSPRIERPLRVVLLADIQTDRVGAYERRVLQRAAGLHPDLVLFAGDYLQLAPGLPRRLSEERERLRDALLAARFTPRLGAFAVRGDVDGGGWQAIFEGTGVRSSDESLDLSLGELRLSCLSLGDSRRHDLELRPDGRFHVVLGHAPDFALGEVEADLLLAGHCHGGQVRLPFLGPPITLSAIPRSWTSGVHVIRPNTTLIVSRGVGLERGGAPPLRFNCRPELVVIDLLPVADAPGG
jgi:uncharacterized protein